MGKVKIDVIEDARGFSLCINDYRVCGPKPCDGGKTIISWEAEVDEIKTSMENEMNISQISSCNERD